MLLFFAVTEWNIESVIFRVQYEQNCTLVSQSECRCFYELAIIAFIEYFQRQLLLFNRVKTE